MTLRKRGSRVSALILRPNERFPSRRRALNFPPVAHGLVSRVLWYTSGTSAHPSLRLPFHPVRVVLESHVKYGVHDGAMFNLQHCTGMLRALHFHCRY
jgi:hypothetical protein